MHSSLSMARASSRRPSRPQPRQGAIAVFAAVMMVLVLAMVAYAVDLGYIAVARGQSQRAADAAAHAAVIEFARTGDAREAKDRAHALSAEFASANLVLGQAAALAPETDVRVGRYVFGAGQSRLISGNPDTYNAVRVRIRRTADQNGTVSTFFARALGRAEQAVQAEATAAIIRNVSGFRIPPSGASVPMLPVTVRLKDWEHEMGHGEGSDQWAYEPATRSVSEGADEVPELTLFPRDTGSSGNLGTVNIGVSNNSTAFIGRQIRNGVSESDLAPYEGALQLDDSGELMLSGNPGLSASLQRDFAAIIGQVRIVPLYRSVQGNGNTASYRIVKFVAVRVMASDLRGTQKRIVIQPASLTFNGVIQGSSPTRSAGIYSSPRLVN